MIIPFSVRTWRRAREVILLENPDDSGRRRMRSNKRKRLVVRIAKARVWADELISGRVKDLAEIARRERTSERHIRMGLPLALLAPDLVAAAIAGTLPANLGVSRISQRLSLSWADQRRAKASKFSDL
jgi:site-specific DNA recombinase